jgi:hypothetical protein
LIADIWYQVVATWVDPLTATVGRNATARMLAIVLGLVHVRSASWRLKRIRLWDKESMIAVTRYVPPGPEESENAAGSARTKAGGTSANGPETL